jgi:hypothetical protein
MDDHIPPPTLNFDEIPVVTWEAYEYSPHDPAEAQRDREIMPGAGDGADQQAKRDPRTAPGTAGE